MHRHLGFPLDVNFSDEVNRLWDDLVSVGGDVLDTLLQTAWIAVVAFLIYKIGKRIRDRLVASASKRMQPEASAILNTLITFLLVTVIILVALGMLGVDPSSLVTAISLITAAVSLALQDVLKNFVAGIYLMLERPFNLGDQLNVAGTSGRVEQIDVRTTQLNDGLGRQVIVPNYRVFSEVVVNESAYGLQCMTMKITNIDGKVIQAREETIEVIKLVAGESKLNLRTRIEKVTPETIDLTTRICFQSDAQIREEMVLSLSKQFPAATIEVTEG